ncbi:calcium-binding protein [Piscinibacter sakaiensis]|uniref:calcium-binding protein n=1 Tax=Piscinibacter sakaiensis TaxID=1547922 RepID=UPI003AABFC55
MAPQIGNPSAPGTGLISQQDLAGGVIVNGHSLGGFLAAAFTRLLGTHANAQSTVTFNSPGFRSGSEAAFHDFGSSIGFDLGRSSLPRPGDPAHLNIFGSRGVNVTSNVFYFDQVGKRISVFNEESVMPLPNHSMYKLTDTLAVAAALEALDPGITIPRVNSLFEFGANQVSASLEGVLDGLRSFLDPTSPPTQIGDSADSALSRISLHQNIASMMERVDFATLRGKLAINPSAGTLQYAARNDFAAFVALAGLSPLHITSNGLDDSALQHFWQSSHWQSWHGNWLSDRNRTSSEMATGTANYSDRWIADRAAFLEAVLRYNKLDAGGDVVNSPRPSAYQIVFADLDLNRTLAVRTNGSQPAEHVKFGGAAAEAIYGGGLDDRIYGGGGSDTLYGQAGNDYLEGNAGNDLLSGGADNDTLLGGIGNDTLNGGSGTDLLLGGADFDTYQFDVGWGSDTIVDSDGMGVINVAGIGNLTATGAKKIADSAWQSADKRFNFAVVPVDSGRSDLFITFSDRTDVIRVQNWKSGNLGITLGTTPPTPQPSNSFVGDFIKATSGSQFLIGADGNYVNAGSQPGAADLITGTSGADSIFGHAGDDALLGQGGDDYIDGGPGNDVLQGGLGADTLLGGAGNDIIYGSSNGQLSYPTSTTFQPPTTSHPIVLGRGFNWVMSSPGTDSDGIQRAFLSFSIQRDQQEGDAGNFIDAGPGQDFVIAGTGNDTVYGGDDIDEIFGLAGNDVLHGDGGNDRIYGDGSNQVAGGLEHTLAAQHGSDIIVGGAGNDTLIGQGGEDFIYGGIGDDKLWGDDRSAIDTPASVHGSDFLDGGDGNDELVGGGRGDVLYGGAGNDMLWGDGGGADSLAPSYTDPSLHGADHLDGGDGDDYLMGEGGADKLFGGAGNDMLLGDNTEELLPIAFHGDDLLDGGDGHDTLAGQGGNDTLFGGAGNDFLYGDGLGVSLANHGHDWLDGGDGNDWLEGGGGSDTLIGGTGNDQLFGGDGDDILNGGPEADVLVGGPGDDTYVVVAGEASEGNVSDRIIDDEGSGAVQLRGVDLNAIQLYLVEDGAVVMAWAAGQAVAIDRGLVSSVRRVDTDTGGMSFEKLIGSRLRTPIAMEAVNPEGQLLGGAMDDQLTSSQRGTIFHGGQGNDDISITTGAGATISMSLGDGVDKLVAVARQAPESGKPPAQNALVLDEGFDSSDLKLFRSGTGVFLLSLNDLGDGIRFDAPADAGGRPLPGTQPIDLIRMADGSVLSWQQVVDRGIEVLPSATGGNDVLVLTPLADLIDGQGGDDHIDGLAGNDTIYGGAGNDTLIGGLGNDVLYAGRGIDSVIGGAGDDHLVGGDFASHDFLSGGEGNDEYHFTFGYYTGVSGTAIDTSRSSNDVYHVRDTGYIGGGEYQTWTIDDFGGSADRLHFYSSNITPATTRVTSDGSGLQLRTWNLIVDIRNAIDEQGNAGAGSIESISFRDGTLWNFQQLRSLSLQATAGSDRIYGTGAGELIDGLAGNDSLYGRGGNDTLRGASGYDFLSGGTGNDVLDVGADGGWMIGGPGDDVYQVKAGDGNVRIGSGFRANAEDEGFDVLQLAANQADVTVSFVAATSNWGNIVDQTDQVVVRWKDGSTTVTFEAFGTRPGVCDVVEQIRFANGSTIDVGSFVASQVPAPTTGPDSIRLTSLDTSINGGNGNDTILGRAGNDTILGGAGNDLLDGGYGDDSLDGGAGDDTLIVGAGRNIVVFGTGSGRDTMSGGSATTVQLGSGVTGSTLRYAWRDIQRESAYDSQGKWYWPQVSRATLRISLSSGADWLDSIVDGVHENGTVLGSLRFTDGAAWDLHTVLAMANAGTPGSDLLFDIGRQSMLAGGDGNDTLYASMHGSILRGDNGNDELHGGDGDDRLIGGTGDDTLYGGAGLNTLVYSRGDGNDENDTANGGRTAIEFGAGVFPGEVSLRRADFSTIQAEIAGGGSIRNLRVDRRTRAPIEIRFADGTVWSSEQILASILGGTTGHDTIYGFDEDDLITGGAGNDELLGLRGSDTLDGGAGDDTLYGFGMWGSGPTTDHDVFIGGAGNDRIYGGSGTNTYKFERGFGQDIVDNPATPGGAIVEFGAGILASDIVCSRSFGGQVLLRQSGTNDIVQIRLNANDLIRFADGTTWAAADVQARLVSVASAGADYIIGSAGADTIDALGGDDLVEAGAGNDLVFGGSGNDTLYGEAGNDTLTGGAGNDLLVDSQGDDRYRFNAGDGDDVIIDEAGNNDVLELGPEILPSTTRILADTAGANAGRYRLNFNGSNDQITMTGIDSVLFHDGTVWSRQYIDSQARVAVGTAGNDVLNGTPGPDILNGLQGNDKLYGFAGNDRLDGGPGVDSMYGGTGDDVYFVDHSQDAVYENANEGNDSIFASVTYTLLTNVEYLELTGMLPIDGKGNSLANTLIGNDAANLLNGMAGADKMVGRKGNDTYIVDHIEDQVVEEPGEGIDTVQSSISYTLGANLEYLTLIGSSGISGTGNELGNHIIGNSGNNKLYGLAGSDTLDGGAGGDTMEGGTGNDWYVVDNSKDRIIEHPGQGLDTVLSKITWTLGDNLENLTLIGSSSISGTGNALDNLMIGNAAANTLNGGDGNDTLDGGAGNDKLIGAPGDDLYIVDAAGDVITEYAGQGNDTVMASVTYTLPNHVENLTLTGSAANGTGNALGNLLIGNAAANNLTGGAGNDTLDGGAGNDILVGGTGADTYRFGYGSGLDTIQENDATAGAKDRVEFLGNIRQSDIQFKQIGNNLELLLSAGNDKLVIRDWYLGSAYRVEEFAFSDGTLLVESQVQNLVSAMAGFNAGSAGSTSTMSAQTRHHMVAEDLLTPAMA